MNIFVGGSLSSADSRAGARRQFVERLGEQIVKRDHTLLTGCRGTLDETIAKAASKWLKDRDRDPRQNMISYRLKNDEPVHRCGRIQVSRLHGTPLLTAADPTCAKHHLSPNTWSRMSVFSRKGPWFFKTFPP